MESKSSQNSKNAMSPAINQRTSPCHPTKRRKWKLLTNWWVPNDILQTTEPSQSQPIRTLHSEQNSPVTVRFSLQPGTMCWLKSRKEAGHSECLEISNITGCRRPIDVQGRNRPVIITRLITVDGITKYEAAPISKPNLSSSPLLMIKNQMTTFRNMPLAVWKTTLESRNNLKRALPVKGANSIDPENKENTFNKHRSRPDQVLYLKSGSLYRDCYVRIDKVLELPEQCITEYCYEDGTRPDEPLRLCLRSYKDLVNLLRMPGNRESLYFGTESGTCPPPEAGSCERSLRCSTRPVIAASEDDCRPRSHNELHCVEFSDPNSPGACYFYQW
ncbi:uncharacterized protein LY89DRAFT_672256 [Mollisia scopiformis]|uniref:Uncharacterized protein n=1 Tax=Mollisia scopiformis TaxID=149040 RepID=A0A194X2C7_MOLSC|nr:uncharacterized protein LY89DRAFT_672256 [Mollisia scopiformis]KUJ13987.1 hypothetical protein LY89DRAFT_672256 [Mollisia scopiformis]